MSYANRRRYTEMARARGALNAPSCRLSVKEIAQIDRESAARQEAERVRQAESLKRIHHPAIKAPEFKCYRVIRRWQDEEYGEDIGFSRLQAEALMVMNREQGWAIVLDPQGKRIAWNGQTMEAR